MALESSLKRWTEAGLIQAEQAERIVQFERERGRPTLLTAVASLGAFAVAIGLISIVAANWDVIPRAAKLGIDLALLGGVGAGAAHWRKRGPTWLAEAALVVLYGLTLASIALVGQVYQLGGETSAALAYWTVLTAVPMARGTSAQVGLVWLAGLEVTALVWLGELAEVGDAFAGLAIAASYWVPLTCIALGRSAWLARARPLYARVLSAVGWAELLFAASIGTLAFYERQDFPAPGGLWLGVLASAAGTAALLASSPPSPHGRGERWLLSAGFVVAHLGLLFSSGDAPLWAALSFIALWSVVAVAAHQRGLRAALHFATALIGLRLLVIYFEVIGSLLDTGMALLVGGVLTLVLTFLWARQGKALDRGLARGANPSQERPS